MFTSPPSPTKQAFPHVLRDLIHCDLAIGEEEASIEQWAPKPLVKSDWRPSTVICMDDSRSYTKVDSFIHEFDLVFQINGQNNYWNSIHHDTQTIWDVKL